MLLLLIPFLLLRGVFMWWESIERHNDLERLRSDLYAEAKQFKTDLKPETWLQERMGHVIRRFGFERNASADARRSFDIPVAKRFSLICRALRRLTQAPHWMVLLTGPQGRDLHLDLNPAYKTRLTHTELHALVASSAAAFIKVNLPAPTSSAALDLSTQINQQLNPLFGCNAHLFNSDSSIRPFTSNFRDFGTGYIGRWNGPGLASDTDFPCLGTLFLLYHADDLPLSLIERFARKRAAPGFSREIRWEPIAPLPRLSGTERGLALVTSLVDTEFAQRYHRQHRERLKNGLQPVIIIRGSYRRSDAQHSRRSLVDHFSYLSLCFSFMLLWRLAAQNTFGDWSLSAKLRLGFALCLLPVLGSLVIASGIWLQLQRANEQIKVRRFLETHLNQLNQMLRHLVDAYGNVLTHHSEKLVPALSLPRPEAARFLHTFKITASIDYQGLYNHTGLYCENVFGKPLAETLAILFQTMAPELLRMANPNLIDRTQLPSGIHEMSQTFMNEYMDMQSFGYSLGNPDRLCRTPFGNVQSWYQIRFLRPHPDERPQGVLVNYGYYTFFNPSLRKLFNYGLLPSAKPEEYQLDCLVLRYQNLINRNTSSIVSSLPETSSQYAVSRTLAEQSMNDLVSRFHTTDDASGSFSILAQPLSEDFAIGAACARPIQSLRQHQLLFIVLFSGGLAVFLYALISTISWYLLRPLKAFLRATAQAANGVFDWRLDLRTADECEVMAAELNQMAVKLIERGRMTRFVSDDVVRAISDFEDQAVKPGGQSIVTTVLVSDIRGFTTLSEQHSAEDIVSMLNAYFTAMEEAILTEGGIIVQMIGDAIVAHFPAKDQELRESASRAVRAAIAMRRALEEYNQSRRVSGLFTVQTGIGISGGSVLSAVVGSTTGRLGHTLIGPAIDRAVDLETLSKQARATGIMIESNLCFDLPEGCSLVHTSDSQSVELAVST